MSSNLLTINLTGTTRIEVNYSGTVSNIKTATVSVNGSSRPNATKKLKSPFAYVSSKQDGISLIINKSNQFKVSYKNVYVAKGNLNSGPIALSETIITEEEVNELNAPGCGFTNELPTPSVTPTQSVTPSVTPTVTSSVTPTVTPTVTPSVTPSTSISVYQTFNVTAAYGNYNIDGSVNPTLTLTRGKLYNFNINASGHPFYIKTTTGTGTGNQYNDGVTNNGTDNGTIVFLVPNNALSTLYYQCQYHSSMNGTINIISE